ncbi:MAG: DUF5654 family protein [Candidatus Pacearchaeota archaeon]
MAKKKRNIRHRTRKINREFRKASSVAIIGAVGFVTGLAWMDVIREFFNSVLGDSSLQNSLVSAIAVTVLTVIVIMIVSRIKPSDKE